VITASEVLAAVRGVEELDLAVLVQHEHVHGEAHADN
jgi:hypothetical protein